MRKYTKGKTKMYQSGQGQHASGGALKLSGQGQTAGQYAGNMEGDGSWRKKLGISLMSIGSIVGSSTIAGKKTSETSNQLIGSSMLAGIGGALLASHHIRKKKRQKKKAKKAKKAAAREVEGGGLMDIKKLLHSHVHDHLLKKLQQNPHHIFSGGTVTLSGGGIRKKLIVTLKHAKDFYKKHHNTPMTIQEMMGKDWKKKGKLLVSLLHHKEKEGSGILKKIGKSVKHALAKSKKAIYNWADGGTKFKPSDLMKVYSKIISIEGKIGSYVIPGASTIAGMASSQVDKYGAKLKSQGRGIKVPQKFITLFKKLAKKHPKVLSKLLSYLKKMRGGDYAGEGIGESFTTIITLARGIKSFIKWLKDNNVSWASIREHSELANLNTWAAGRGQIQGEGKILTAVLRRFVNKYPEKAQQVVREIEKKQRGSGVIDVSKKFVGLGLKLYRFLKANPQILEALKIIIKQALLMKKSGDEPMEDEEPMDQEPAEDVSGSGVLPIGVSMMGNGKIKRDRYSVFYGYHPKTKSGLMKKDFLLRGKKVISKKRSQMGKAMYQQGRGLYK
jgi:hypothetical protein